MWDGATVRYRSGSFGSERKATPLATFVTQSKRESLWPWCSQRTTHALPVHHHCTANAPPLHRLCTASSHRLTFSAPNCHLRINLRWGWKLEHLLAQRYDQRFGVRSIENAIESEVVSRLAAAQEKGDIGTGDTVTLYVRDDRVWLTMGKPPVPQGDTEEASGRRPAEESLAAAPWQDLAMQRLEAPEDGPPAWDAQDVPAMWKGCVQPRIDEV